MFHLDNNSGIDVMPGIKQTLSRLTKWFTEGDSQTPPSYPGADWFNIVQAELLNVLKEAEITPAKNELNQLSRAIKAIIDKNKIKIPDASLTTKGIVQLNSATNSDSQTEAATLLAVKKTYDRANTANANAISANSNANNAHYKIDASNIILNSLASKFGTIDKESAVFSGDKNYRFVMRNDGWGGVYCESAKKTVWGFNYAGELSSGTVPASSVTGLAEYIKKMYTMGRNQFAGFTRLPNGLLIQWGGVNYLASTGSVGTVCSFYTAFPNLCLSIITSDNGEAVNSTASLPVSASQFKVWGRQHNGSYADSFIYYIAIGV